jgi:hypothetical protein
MGFVLMIFAKLFFYSFLLSIFPARVNSLYRVRSGRVAQVVKNDPQLPQSFYPLQAPMDMREGDIIIGQCVYDNDDDRAISVG